MPDMQHPLRAALRRGNEHDGKKRVTFPENVETRALENPYAIVYGLQPSELAFIGPSGDPTARGAPSRGRPVHLPETRRDGRAAAISETP